MSEPAAAPRSDGCLGKGCLVLIPLSILLMLALAAGALWGIQHLRQTYSAPAPAELPKAAATPVASVALSTEEASPLPTVGASSRDRLREIQTRWYAFERAAAQGQKARIEMSADEINALIEGDPQLRGKAFVSIVNNAGRVRVSIPLDQFFMLGGRFLNGEATIEASPDGDPAKARITSVVLADQSVPDNILDRRMFGWLPIRTMINQWLEQHDIAVFRIVDDKVIGETAGSTR